MEIVEGNIDAPVVVDDRQGEIVNDIMPGNSSAISVARDASISASRALNRVQDAIRARTS